MQFLPLSAQQCPAEQYERAAVILSVVLLKIVMSSITKKKWGGWKDPCGDQGSATFP